RAVELRLRQVAEPPVRSGRSPEAVQRHRRIARDDEPRVGQPAYHLERVLDPLVGTDHTESEQRVPVVAALCRARVHGVRDDGRLASEFGQDVRAAPGVYDDTVEAAE